MLRHEEQKKKKGKLYSFNLSQTVTANIHHKEKILKNKSKKSALTVYSATIHSESVPGEVVHGWVGLTAAGQGQGSARVHHAGRTSQN